MNEAQEERLKRMGGKTMDQVLDEQIGLKGSPERVAYEKELEKEMKKQNKHKERYF